MNDVVYNISLTVEGQEIKLSQPKIAAGLVGLVYVTVDFKVWGDFNNVMRFFYKGSDPIDIIMSGERVKVPSSVIKYPGFSLAIGGYAKDGSESFIPTVLAEVRIERSGYGKSETSISEETDTASFEAQIISIAKTAEKVAKIGENGNWYIYDAESMEYCDSGFSAKGEKGESGYTPQKYIDYYTDEDIEEIKLTLGEDIENLSTEVEAIGEGLSEVESYMGNMEDAEHTEIHTLAHLIIDYYYQMYDVNNSNCVARLLSDFSQKTGYDNIGAAIWDLCNSVWGEIYPKVGYGSLSGFSDLVAAENNYANELYMMQDGFIKYDISQLMQRVTALEESFASAYSLERTNYSYAFANTAYETLPVKEIEAETIIYMLMNCQKLTSCSDVTVEVKSDNPSALYVCANCSAMKVAPTFIFKSSSGESAAAVCKTWTSAFLNCASMTTCEVYLGDGSQNPITTRNMFQNTFKNCVSLENLTFSGYGSPMYLDLSDCEKLTAESMQSLKAALCDVSEAESGTYEIKMAEGTYNLYSDEEKEEIAALGWTITIA